MPSNGYSVGRDVTLVFQTAAGALPVARLTNFNMKQGSTEVRVKRMDGISDTVRFFDGWNGTANSERIDSTLDDYFAQLEANYYAGLDEQAIQIYETITEMNGSITQYRFDGVFLSLDDAGSWAGDQTVKQSLKITASRRVKTA